MGRFWQYREELRRRLADNIKKSPGSYIPGLSSNGFMTTAAVYMTNFTMACGAYSSTPFTPYLFFQ